MSAQRRKIARAALLFLAAVPLAIKIPYLWRAWMTSPIDRAHLNLYGVLALVAAGIAVVVLCRRPARAPIKGKGLALAAAALVVFVAGFAVGILRDVNALQLISAVGILWSAAWLASGHTAALLFAPAALLAMVSVPGTLYWMRNISAAYAIETRAAFVPAFTPSSQPGMLGREMPPSPGFARFFRTSDAHQFAYADISNSVGVLAVKIGGDIHEIHPATHCLRTSGWRIASEEIVQVAHPDGGVLDVDEAICDSIDGRLLVWIWFSSDKLSTGSFLHFRRMYSESENWYTYQVSTPVGGGDEGLAAARKRLQRFLAREKMP